MEKLITPDFGVMFWTMVNFALVVLLLGKFAWRPVLNALEEREKRLSQDRQAAESARNEAEKIRRELEEKFSKLAADELRTLSEAAARGEKEKDKIVDSAKKEAQTIVQSAKAEIGREKDRLISELRKEVAGLSIMAAEKITGASVDRSVGEKVVEEMFREVYKAG